MRKTLRVKSGLLALFITLGLIVWAAVVLSNPLRRSPESIRAWLLRQTPLGTPVAQVHTLLKTKGWYDSDYRRENLGYSAAGRPENVVGEFTLRGYLGTRRPCRLRFYLERVDVEAFWVFDSEGALIAIDVKKYSDSL